MTTIKAPGIASLLNRLRRRRGEVFARFAPRRLDSATPGDVSNVLVILSASRSGSSFLHHLLARRSGVVALNGEGGVFARLHDIGIPAAKEDSDFIAPNDPAAVRAASAIATDMLRDAGMPLSAPPRNGADREVYLADCVQRLLLQYPEVDADPAKLQRLCAAALDGPEGSSTASYWATLLRSISRDLLPVSPAHYDLRGSDPAADFPDRGNGGTPPFVDFAMEEPPFVVPQPRRIPGKKDLAGRTLLLKSSSDCYRIWLLRALFPAARFKFVLLARNPAGAISGLIDGWLSDGFYSHNVGRFSALHVAGYSRPDRPWTERWWNFDLPPGWHDQRERSIQEACGHQWLSANQHIRSAVADGLIADRIEVQYESLLEAASLKSEISRIAEFAGLGPDPAAAAAAGPIMSVTPPAPQKWRKRRDALAPLVSGGPIAEMATRLGYDPAVWESWQ